MKLRIRCNSVRIRVDRKDIAELVDRGRVVDALRFGPGSTHTFTYAVIAGTAPLGQPRADYSTGLLLVTIHPDDVAAWAGGNQVGFNHEQVVEGGTVRVLLEKDLACVDRPASEEVEDAWAFPNPSVVCK